MCDNCTKYVATGCAYCLECGSSLNLKKEASNETEGMFKHASEDLDLENLIKDKNDTREKEG
jgi:hypothetical protein